jgi:hypothetical protein
MQFRVLYVVLWAKINIVPITRSERWQNIQFPGDHENLELRKRTLFRWKPMHSFTDTRILNIHGTKSHCGCICVCGCWGGFQIFPVSVSVKCSIPNNASQQCFPEVSNFGMAQCCYSKDQVWQPVRWGNVQHSLNMSTVCSTILRHVSMCIIGLIQMISITVSASHIVSREFVLISSLA